MDVLLFFLSARKDDRARRKHLTEGPIKPLGKKSNARKEVNYMATKKYPKLDVRRDLYVSVWRQFAETESFAGMTLEQFIAATEGAMTARQNLIDARALLANLVGERNTADVEMRKTLALIINAVRGNAQFGENSSMYRSMGFVPKSERATGKTNRPTTPPANAA